MSLIADDRLDVPTALDTLAPSENLYALGMPVGLASELLVLDGVRYEGRMVADRHVASIGSDSPIAFAAYTNIEDWSEGALPDGPVHYDVLETTIVTEAVKLGLVPQDGLAVRLKGRATSLDWFVVGGMGDLHPTPRDSFLAARTLGRLSGRDINAFGIHAPKWRGRATSPDTDFHMHFATVDDAAPFIGHIDRGLTLAPGAQLWLAQL